MGFDKWENMQHGLKITLKKYGLLLATQLDSIVITFSKYWLSFLALIYQATSGLTYIDSRTNTLYC